MTTEAKPAELRECPFCGEDVYIDGHLESDNYSYWITIRCCEVEMRFSLMWHEFSKRTKRDGEPRTLKWMERQLARLWNSRPSDDLRAENERLREALTPSGDTKAVYMGEFTFGVTEVDEDGDEVSRKVYVPWTTIKDIMAAILARAALQDKTHD